MCLYFCTGPGVTAQEQPPLPAARLFHGGNAIGCKKASADAVQGGFEQALKKSGAGLLLFPGKIPRREGARRGHSYICTT